MDREERERQRHVRHWATFMIMHLEGREGDAPRYTYRESLQRLRELVDAELTRAAQDAAAPLERPSAA